MSQNQEIAQMQERLARVQNELCGFDAVFTARVFYRNTNAAARGGSVVEVWEHDGPEMARVRAAAIAAAAARTPIDLSFGGVYPV